MSDKSVWDVVESVKIRDLIGENTFRTPDGNMKNIGGDIHSTVDINPESSTFGEIHSTVQLPGDVKIHSS